MIVGPSLPPKIDRLSSDSKSNLLLVGTLQIKIQGCKFSFSETKDKIRAGVDDIEGGAQSEKKTTCMCRIEFWGQAQSQEEKSVTGNDFVTFEVFDDSSCYTIEYPLFAHQTKSKVEKSSDCEMMRLLDGLKQYFNDMESFNYPKLYFYSPTSNNQAHIYEYGTASFTIPFPYTYSDSSNRQPYYYAKTKSNSTTTFTSKASLISILSSSSLNQNSKYYDSFSSSSSAKVIGECDISSIVFRMLHVPVSTIIPNTDDSSTIQSQTHRTNIPTPIMPAKIKYPPPCCPSDDILSNLLHNANQLQQQQRQMMSHDKNEVLFNHENIDIGQNYCTSTNNNNIKKNSSDDLLESLISSHYQQNLTTFSSNVLGLHSTQGSYNEIMEDIEFLGTIHKNKFGRTDAQSIKSAGQSSLSSASSIRSASISPSSSTESSCLSLGTGTSSINNEKLFDTNIHMTNNNHNHSRLFNKFHPTQNTSNILTQQHEIISKNHLLIPDTSHTHQVQAPQPIQQHHHRHHLERAVQPLVPQIVPPPLWMHAEVSHISNLDMSLIQSLSLSDDNINRSSPKKIKIIIRTSCNLAISSLQEIKQQQNKTRAKNHHVSSAYKEKEIHIPSLCANESSPSEKKYDVNHVWQPALSLNDYTPNKTDNNDESSSAEEKAVVLFEIWALETEIFIGHVKIPLPKLLFNHQKRSKGNEVNHDEGTTTTSNLLKSLPSIECCNWCDIILNSSEKEKKGNHAKIVGKIFVVVAFGLSRQIRSFEKMIQAAKVIQYYYKYYKICPRQQQRQVLKKKREKQQNSTSSMSTQQNTTHKKGSEESTERNNSDGSSPPPIPLSPPKYILPSDRKRQERNLKNRNHDHNRIQKELDESSEPKEKDVFMHSSSHNESHYNKNNTTTMSPTKEKEDYPEWKLNIRIGKVYGMKELLIFCSDILFLRRNSINNNDDNDITSTIYDLFGLSACLFVTFEIDCGSRRPSFSDIKNNNIKETNRSCEEEGDNTIFFSRSKMHPLEDFLNTSDNDDDDDQEKRKSSSSSSTFDINEWISINESPQLLNVLQNKFFSIQLWFLPILTTTNANNNAIKSEEALKFMTDEQSISSLLSSVLPKGSQQIAHTRVKLSEMLNSNNRCKRKCCGGKVPWNVLSSYHTSSSHNSSNNNDLYQVGHVNINLCLMEDAMNDDDDDESVRTLASSITSSNTSISSSSSSSIVSSSELRTASLREECLPLTMQMQGQLHEKELENTSSIVFSPSSPSSSSITNIPNIQNKAKNKKPQKQSEPMIQKVLLQEIESRNQENKTLNHCHQSSSRHDIISNVEETKVIESPIERNSKMNTSTTTITSSNNKVEDKNDTLGSSSPCHNLSSVFTSLNLVNERLNDQFASSRRSGKSTGKKSILNKNNINYYQNNEDEECLHYLNDHSKERCIKKNKKKNSSSNDRNEANNSDIVKTSNSSHHHSPHHPPLQFSPIQKRCLLHSYSDDTEEEEGDEKHHPYHTTNQQNPQVISPHNPRTSSSYRKCTDMQVEGGKKEKTIIQVVKVKDTGCSPIRQIQVQQQEGKGEEESQESTQDQNIHTVRQKDKDVQHEQNSMNENHNYHSRIELSHQQSLTSNTNQSKVEDHPNTVSQSKDIAIPSSIHEYQSNNKPHLQSMSFVSSSSYSIPLVYSPSFHSKTSASFHGNNNYYTDRCKENVETSLHKDSFFSTPAFIPKSKTSLNSGYTNRSDGTFSFNAKKFSSNFKHSLFNGKEVQEERDDFDARTEYKQIRKSNFPLSPKNMNRESCYYDSHLDPHIRYPFSSFKLKSTPLSFKDDVSSLESEKKINGMSSLIHKKNMNEIVTNSEDKDTEIIHKRGLPTTNEVESIQSSNENSDDAIAPNSIEKKENLLTKSFNNETNNRIAEILSVYDDDSSSESTKT